MGFGFLFAVMSHCIPAAVCIKPKLNCLPRHLSLQGKKKSELYSSICRSSISSQSSLGELERGWGSGWMKLISVSKLLIIYPKMGGAELARWPVIPSVRRTLSQATLTVTCRRTQQWDRSLSLSLKIWIQCTVEGENQLFLIYTQTM